jgi:CRISPR-associated protein (TIGR02584 family)
MTRHPPETCTLRVLLAVTGLSPQIVTETIYALAVRREWVPTEVRIVTTRRGAENARSDLLSFRMVSRLCEDYRLPEIAFGPESIHVIMGSLHVGKNASMGMGLYTLEW